jgi:hypothetical protein
MTETIYNHDWLQAIDDRPETTIDHLLAAYDLLGVKTDQTTEQLDPSIFELHLLWFLRPVDISDDGWNYTYAFRIPDKVAA